VNEIGSSMATVVTGPIPGSTPMMVPSRTPMKQQAMFWMVSATANPRPRFEISGPQVRILLRPPSNLRNATVYERAPKRR
jgi:hypothetical protein